MTKHIYNEINNTVSKLKKGKVIIYPTDTLWGIGCLSDNYDAIKKIFYIKKRNINKSMILLVDSLYLLNKLVYISKTELNIIYKFNNPVTIIYNKIKENNIISKLLINNNTIAIRLTKNFFCKNVINILRKPIVSTSANISNSYIVPNCFDKIPTVIKKNVDYIVNLYKQKIFFKPSTIIKINNKSQIRIIRK